MRRDRILRAATHARVMINGTADPMGLMMAAGLASAAAAAGGRGDVWSASARRSFSPRADGCDRRPRKPGEPGSGRWHGGDTYRLAELPSGTTVTLYRVEGGGHALPGRRSLFRASRREQSGLVSARSSWMHLPGSGPMNRWMSIISRNQNLIASAL